MIDAYEQLGPVQCARRIEESLDYQLYYLLSRQLMSPSHTARQQ